MPTCVACDRPKPCRCCSCTRDLVNGGRVSDPRCPVASHSLTPVELGTLIGAQMAEVRARQIRWY